MGREGHGPFSAEELKAFSEFPLLWLGESFAGYNLQWAGHIERGEPGARDAWNAVTFIYGTCTPYDETEPSCPAPVTVHVRPACSVTPSSILPGVVRSTERVRGGAELVRFRDGHVMLWTGDVSVEIHLLARPEAVDEAIAALRGLGAGATPPGAALPSPRLERCAAPGS